MARLTPNPEQEAILDAFQDERDLIIKAAAGTGKTTTLRMMAEAEPDLHMLYLAFNRAVVDEAKGRFPRRTRVSTAHSLAYGWMQDHEPRLMKKLNNGYHYDSVLAGWLHGGREKIRISNAGRAKEIGPMLLMKYSLATVRAYLQSADRRIEPHHFRRPDNIVEESWEEARAALEDIVLDGADRALDDLWDPNGDMLTFSHDSYLKAWQLRDPDLADRFEVIMLDEAQDASPVIADVVMKQQGDAQLILVGDENQAIFGFTGAINAIAEFQKLNSDATVLPLTESYRFGPPIADRANSILSALESDIKVSGLGGPSEVDTRATGFGEVDAVLARTNAGAVREALAAVEAGLRPSIKADTKSMLKFCQAAEKLISGKRTQHPELADFRTWEEFEEFVDSNSGAADYAIYLYLIATVGVEKLVRLLEEIERTDDRRADVVISTAHKVKGLEWPTVRLSSDFPDEFSDESELMLAYVAATRAMTTLMPGKLWPLTEHGVPLSEELLWRLADEVDGDDALVTAVVKADPRGDAAAAVADLRTRTRPPALPERPKRATAAVVKKAAPKRDRAEDSATPEQRAAACEGELEAVVWKRYGHHFIFVNGGEKVRLGRGNVKTGAIEVEPGAVETAVRREITSHPDWELVPAE